MADKEADFTGVMNPKRTLDRREAEASEKKNGRDAGDLEGPNKDFFKGGMSQAQFSGYPKGGKSSPPADMIKKRNSKE